MSQRDYDYVTNGFIGSAISKILRSELKLDKNTVIQIVQQNGYNLTPRGHPRCQSKKDEEKKDRDRQKCRKYYSLTMNNCYKNVRKYIEKIKKSVPQRKETKRKTQKLENMNTKFHLNK